MHPIVLRGARTHSLRGVDLELRPGELVAVTGVSGAGKSSLAFDTLYSEGQRRFVESFSPYARQFLERLERPPVDRLDPVAAGVAVDRKAPIKSSRSTLATMADLEAYLSALFLRVARPRCPDCGVLAEQRDPDASAEQAIADLEGDRAIVTYPTFAADTEDYLEVREALLEEGYRRLLIDGETRDLDAIRPTEALAAGGRIDVVVDRVAIGKRGRRRIAAALEAAWRLGEGRADLHVVDVAAPKRVPVARGLVCPACARSFAPPKAGLFSYESAVGACATCRGFGRVLGIDWRKVVPDPSLTLAERAIKPWAGPKASWERRVLARYCAEHGIPMDVPWGELSESQRERVFQGEGKKRGQRYPGVRAWFDWLQTKQYKMHVRVFLARFRAYDVCPDCDGKRLGPESLMYEVDGLDLGQWHGLELRHARRRLRDMETAVGGQGAIARAELERRLGYLEHVGLGYLTLDRQARTLSGGEAQRVSLTAALGTSLTGALFVLDEPTVGLHPTDLEPLVDAMRELARRDNVVVVVEHDPRVIEAADRVVELGPGAGRDGGRVVFDGTPAEARARGGATARAMEALAKRKPKKRAKAGELVVLGARENNLAIDEVRIPLGGIVAVCGPSGSGKSTLVEEILYRAAARALGDFRQEPPGQVQRIDGFEQLRAVELVDQSPLGRTSRGNAATYTGAWTRIRALFAATPEAEVREIGPGHFSFNVSGGRCEACSGEGAETVEMQFLADVRLVCPACKGRRFREEVLEVRVAGLNVAQMLEATVDQALELFADEAAVVKALEPVAALGLGYLPLGQPLSTLSGGEAQRLKLARALREVGPGTLLVLDEPSAGLHASEVARLDGALRQLVAEGATVVVVDHDPAVIDGADWCLELGPGAGSDGGRLVAACTPAALRRRRTRTGEALRRAYAPPAAGTERPARRAPLRAIEVHGAREHNLTGIDVAIPHGELVVVTGPSGSGKSSLAFDVIFAEGQRRFLETLTPYARQFLPVMPRPDVDRVDGVPPSVALEQRTSRAGASSTVATVTEIAHYLRLLYAKVGDMHCPDCDLPVTSASGDTLLSRLRERRGHVQLRAPVVRARKGVYYDVFNAAHRAGIERAICDGELVDTDAPPKLKKSKEHSIDLILYEGAAAAVPRAVFDRALAFAEGQVVLAGVGSVTPRGDDELWSSSRICPSCQRSLPELDPRWFSFNTAQGRCRSCEGSGFRGGAAALREALDASEDEEGPVLEPCRSCDGARLAPIPRAVRLFGERYHEASARSVASMLDVVRTMAFEGDRATIAEAPLAELERRLAFVERVGLGYLGLDRRARTLSGGEMQRLRLAAQLGAGLTGALYVLDEPTIGLHPRDTGRLLDNLRALVDTGSTVLVVEHDADCIRAADRLVDLGPRGGRGGGHVMAVGSPAEVLASELSPTAKAIAEEGTMHRRRDRLGPAEHALRLTGARANNLRGDPVSIPLGRMVVIAGVSGSGKSTLVSHVLYPALRAALGRVTRAPGAHDAIDFPEAIVQRCIAVDQSPIGRTSRSVPATYLDVWDPIRRVFAATPEARAFGYKPGRFSFNSASAGGRCEACKGSGVIAHEMAFLPDVKTTCSACGGARFEPGTLEVRYRGLSIGDVLRLTVEEAVEVFAAHPKIVAPLTTLRDLGVGYVQLGQGSPTLSGGEAQRLKLARELTAGRAHKPTLYVLDEPTTGLHHSDVGRLVEVLDRLVQRGDSLVIIEHHPAVIAAGDHVIELGPEGGEAGGRVVAQGTPRAVAAEATATGEVLRRLLDEGARRSA